MLVRMLDGGDSTRFQHGFCLRPATESDLDDITRIHIEGFTEEPYEHYCYPWREEYPEDYWRWTREEYERYLKQPHKYVVHVLDAASEADGAVNIKPAGVAIWNIAVLAKALSPGPGFRQRKDANFKHLDAFVATSGKRFTTTYFAKYAEKQVNLATLVVHPDFRRRGAGTMLVNWGIEAAEKQRWPVTLCASPMGRLLYEHLKFGTIATERVQCEGEEEVLESTVMVLPWEQNEIALMLVRAAVRPE